ncbi:hypothetical protein NPIL_241551 [Nephila pilipes]|uniref:Uncharacterized protein n=1 Tax=Nephila pilipes TaxID=299642 RepID=A0A8X6NP93_NEPPI|nr:hypothetical protein NPIL_241551 [Nephila pilipes]
MFIASDDSVKTIYSMVIVPLWKLLPHGTLSWYYLLKKFLSKQKVSSEDDMQTAITQCIHSPGVNSFNNVYMKCSHCKTRTLNPVVLLLRGNRKSNVSVSINVPKLSCYKFHYRIPVAYF